MSPHFRPFLRQMRRDVQASRGRYAWILFATIVLLLVFELVPKMPWPHWLYLTSALAMVMCCLDFNLMVWRVYQKRGDLRPVRLTLGLVSMFITLIAVGRIAGFASLFFEALLTLASLVNLLAGLVALVLVLMARSVEDYALTMPKLADLQAAHQELNETHHQLDVREQHALEGMTIMADDTIIEANPAAYRILGYDAASNELLGLRAHQLLHEDDNALGYAALKQTHSAPYVVRVICKDGTLKHVQTTGTTIPRNNTVVRVTNFRDVSLERRYLQLIDIQNREAPTYNASLVQDLATLREYFQEPASDNAISHVQ